ncbi:hypothetical protein I4F81_010186 [Pyropia yezoensis]|uniref:Uncharacterized protein n=1 Tax=Pyropia yezoensis TaxID=2788 RepID=A0ACC3CD32_PYRYE|nr:hypothetical protein I4F81_010186 [Neopyropia yezoensis]
MPHTPLLSSSSPLDDHGGRAGRGARRPLLLPYRVVAMPVPTRWHPGMPDEVDFPPLAEWANLPATSTAVEVNADLGRVAKSHHTDCLWRVGEVRWELPTDFVDVMEADPVATYEGTRLADIHGVPAAGSPGVQSVTYMALVFANELLRQLSRAQGIQPWVRRLYVVAVRHHDGRHSSPVHSAAMAFDRLRREWPHARFVEGEIYDGLDIMYAPTTAAMPALSALSAALRQHSSASYSETTPVDMDLSVRGGGYLKTPPLAGSKLKRRRVAAMLGGYACPVWAAWLNVHEAAQAAEMVALPDLFVESGLSVPPTMPRLAEHVFSYLGDASHVAWTIVSTEMVFDYAATWFRLLREQEVLVRLKRALLEVFARLPVGDLQAGSPDGYALAFHNCVVGALAFPWADVTTYVEAGGVGDAAREVAVRYLPLTSHGFAALERLPGFPMVDESSDGGPMRRQDGDDGEGPAAGAALPVVVPGAWGRNLGAAAPEFRPVVRSSRSARAASLRRGAKRAAARLAASVAAEEGERADDRRRARASLEADQARARAKRAALAGAPSGAPAGRQEADRLNAGRFQRRSSSVPLGEPVVVAMAVDGDVNDQPAGPAGTAGARGAQDAARASAARAGAAARAAAVEEAERRAAAADVAARRRAAAFAEKQWREAGEARPRRPVGDGWAGAPRRGRGGPRGRGRGHGGRGGGRGRWPPGGSQWSYPSGYPSGAAAGPFPLDGQGEHGDRGGYGPGAPPRPPAAGGPSAGADGPSPTAGKRGRAGVSPGRASADGERCRPRRRRSRSEDAASGRRSSRGRSSSPRRRRSSRRSGRRRGRSSSASSSSSPSQSPSARRGPRSGSGSRRRSRTPSGYRCSPGWVRLVGSDADEAAFRRIFRAEDVRRLRRMYIPAGLHNRVWCETTRVTQQALLAEVDRFHGATHVAASRGLGDAAVTAASRATLYDRFMRALDELVRDLRGESPGRFNAHDLGH